MDLFKKIQALPETKRKIIFWAVLALAIILSFSFWVKKVKRTLEGFERESFLKEIKPPSFYESEGFQEETLENELEQLQAIKEAIEGLEESELKD